MSGRYNVRKDATSRQRKPSAVSVDYDEADNDYAAAQQPSKHGKGAGGKAMRKQQFSSNVQRFL